MACPRSFGARLGARIRARRTAKGLSQAALAESADVSANYIGVLERGVKLPTLDTLVALAKVLGCSAAELLDDPRAKDSWLDELVSAPPPSLMA